MANVAHSGLTGADLHEPKGVATATAGKVYVSDGAGSGAWTSLDLSIPGDSLKDVYCIIDSQAQGTNGGTFTAGSYVTRTLNTELTNRITGATLAANVISLPAGNYYCIASAPALGVGAHKIRLYNSTNSTNLLTGTSAYTSSGNAVETTSNIAGYFTIAGTKSVVLQHQCQITKATNGLGVASNFSGETETYAMITLWRFED